jgi:hypothetical protein
VAYLEDGKLICAAVRERQPPFKPTEVMETMVVPLFKMYGVTRAKADKHAEGFVKDLAQRAGVTIEADAPVKSDIYREMMPWMTSGKCRLPPLDRLVNQIFGLERTRGGERIDHCRGGRDDLVNAAFGAMLMAAGGAGSAWMHDGSMRRALAQMAAMTPNPKYAQHGGADRYIQHGREQYWEQRLGPRRYAQLRRGIIPGRRPEP